MSCGENAPPKVSLNKPRYLQIPRMKFLVSKERLTLRLRLRHVGTVSALGGRNLDGFVGPQRRESDVGRRLFRREDVRQEVLGHTPVRVLGVSRSQFETDSQRALKTRWTSRDNPFIGFSGTPRLLKTMTS